MAFTRRGIGSNLNRLGVDDSFIQKVLRHANVSTTQQYYIKTTAADTRESMLQLEAEIERLQRLRATLVPSPTEEAEKPKFVN